MAKSKQKIDPIPDEFTSFDELANFWETHDLTDYEDQLQKVKYKVARKPTRKFVVTLSDELTKALRKATHREGVSMQTLVNLWVQERLQQYPTVSP
jgi:predicted DNA binding CopG/RHH family protein